MTKPEFRSGYVAIVGRPNAGKSTLLNHLIGQKISITSRKPQTTRHRVTGILTRPDAQLVFVDTPGFQSEHRTALNRIMYRAIGQAFEGVDALIWVIEAMKFEAPEEAFSRHLPSGVPVILAINKMDRLTNKRAVLPFMSEMNARFPFAAIVPISAQKDQHLDELLKAVTPHLPVREPLYGEDEITTASERFLAGELVREKLFRLLGDELPYATAVEVEKFETEGALRRIYVRVLVEKASQKSIVIGKGGEKLKLIATQSRKDMEKLFGGKVFLEIFVAVKSGWADDEAALRRMGYE